MIHSVVGAPIDCPKTSKEHCTNELIAEYHAKYVERLSQLHDKWKPLYEKEKGKRQTQLANSSEARKKALENERLFGRLKLAAKDMKISQ